MRYLRVRLAFAEQIRHPMHEFLVTHPEMAREELWTWRFVGDLPTMLFRVVGPVGPYRKRIADVDSVAEYTLTPVTDEAFYAVVRATPTSGEWDWILAFARESIVVVPPVTYTDTGTAVFEVLGDPDDLRGLLADLPPSVDTTVERLGACDRRRSPEGVLTERQRDVVATALELGYYEVPRDATVAEVAAELDITDSTVSAHLRKAESAVMRGLSSQV
jgi:DNA-binding CsgD family transcriptional regulator